MFPKVSIGIPAYKPEFLGEAIASVLAQTYEDWELIVVDDCSPADIKGIVGKFNDPRIRYYKNEHNIGGDDPSYNWDRCVSYARGEFFCLLCDDDLYYPTFLEEMMKLTEQFPDCHVFRARAQFIDGHGKMLRKYPSPPLWESCEDYIWHMLQGLRMQSISEWMISRQRIEEKGGYVHFPRAWTSDMVSVYRFSVEGGIASCYKILVYFRYSGLNITSQPGKYFYQMMDALVMEKEHIVGIIRENGMDDKLEKMAAVNHEKWVRWQLGTIGIGRYLKVILFERKKYGLSRRMVLVDTVKRFSRLLFVR